MQPVLSESAHEAERLETLHRYGILDTSPEAAFDRITSLAARLFETPIALIVFADAERVWFKSRYGFDIPELPREVWYSLTSLHQEGQVILDIQQDDRLICVRY